MKNLPTIDMVKTGEKIESLRRASGFTVSELQGLIHHNPYISGKRVRLYRQLTIWWHYQVCSR